MTPAQRKALKWLPADGSWKTDPGPVAQALLNLSLSCPYGNRGGYKWRYRLTPLEWELRRATFEDAAQGGSEGLETP